MTGREAWVVVSGEYESWRVECLFESEADARAAVAAGIGEDVQSYRLYAPGEMPRKALMWHARASVTTNHAYAALNRWRDDEPPSISGRTYEQWTHVESGTFEVETSSTEARTFCNVYGEDRDAVLAAITAWYDEQKCLHPAPPS